MRNIRQVRLGYRAAILVTGFALIVSAQAQEEREPLGWSFRAGPVMRFDFKASVERMPQPPLSAGHYENGFVLPDRGGTDSGKTWNWGYSSSSQVQGDSLVFTKLDDVPVPQRSEFDDWAFGGEIIAAYNLVEFEMGTKLARAGVEFGYGYAALSHDLRSSGSATARQTTDRYGLGGITPPPAPYSGSFEGPGPLIDLNYSSRTLVDSPALNTMRGSMDLTLHTFRVGPVFEVDLTPRFGLAFGFGYSSMYTQVDWESVETVSYSRPGFRPSVVSSYDHDGGDWRIGTYAELRLNYYVNRLLGFYLGGDVQYNDDFSYTSQMHRIDLEVGLTYAAKAGVLVRF